MKEHTLSLYAHFKKYHIPKETSPGYIDPLEQDVIEINRDIEESLDNIEQYLDEQGL